MATGFSLKKIEYAVGASGVFASHMHIEGLDRGMIASFGDSYRLEQTFTTDERAIHSALHRMAHSDLDGSTCLYDSIEDAIETFWKYGDRKRPWLLTIITDGNDNASTRYRSTPARIGRYIAEHFNHEPTNFVFLIALGQDNKVDKIALEQIGDSGHFLSMNVDSSPLLEQIFLSIAWHFTTQLAGCTLPSGEATWEQIARMRQMAQIPLDYAFLIDRSASMSGKG